MSQFTIASSGDSSLPVELSSFTATFSDDSVILKWRTETELNNVGFSIHRSGIRKNSGVAEFPENSGIGSEKEDNNYVNIGYVKGAGNSATPKDYEFIDKDVEPELTYFYYLEDIDLFGNKNKSKIIKVVVPVKPIPKEFRLLQNFPNPFNPDTWIPYELAVNSVVVISIYNIRGQLVREWNLGNRKAGYYVAKDKAVRWDGRNDYGEEIASGVYFYRLQTDFFEAMRRMVILK